MGEIDRIHPVVRPILGPRSTERVQPGGDQRRSGPEYHKDEVELSNVESQEEDQDSLPEETVAASEDDSHHLDLSI